MKRMILYFVLALGSLTTVHAQEQPNEEPAKKEQKIKALYVAYITQELQLTESEAQKFWPLHAQFDTELKTLNEEEDMPELDRQQQALNIKKKYQDKFSKILGNNRADDFYKKDDQFRKKLVEQLRKMRQQRNQADRPLRRRP